MIALKSGSVLLAVSALAVLVQSSGVPDGHPGEIALNREGCIRDFIDRLTQFRIGRRLMELVQFSRENYPETFENLIRQRNPRYEAAMGTIQFPHDACNSIFRLFGELKEDRECGRYIQVERERDSFVSELGRLSVRAKTRVEAFHACLYARGRPINDGRAGLIIEEVNDANADPNVHADDGEESAVEDGND